MTCKRFVDRFIWLNRISDPAVECAFESYRSPRIKLYIGFLIFIKAYTFGNLLAAFVSSTYMEDNPEIKEHYCKGKSPACEGGLE